MKGVRPDASASEPRVRPKKLLGQHFLRSQKALNTLRKRSELHPEKICLEIGPGEGVLTHELLSAGKKVIAVEKDNESLAHLQKRFAAEIASKKLVLIDGDIRESLQPDSELFSKILKGKSYSVCANIPYYLTGLLIETLLEHPHQPGHMLLMVQKEVADRLVAKDAKQSVLSIATATFSMVKYIEKVPAGAFFPPPKVDSAIVEFTSIVPHALEDKTIDPKEFLNFVKRCFIGKRKQLGGVVRNLHEKIDEGALMKIFSAAGIDMKARPETLTLRDWEKLFVANSY